MKNKIILYVFYIYFMLFYKYFKENKAIITIIIKAVIETTN